MFIFFNLSIRTPVQTYFNSHSDGCVSVAMTPDSKFICSLGSSHPQVLAIWEWTTDNERPVCSIQLEKSFGSQSNIRFNTDNYFQLLSNSSHQVIFYEWNFENGLKYFDPVINDQVSKNLFYNKILLLSNYSCQAYGKGNLTYNIGK